MKIIMPAAGLGSRFTKIGINTPKPLIEILGKPMIKWAAASIPFAKPEDFIFIVRGEQIENYQIDEKLMELFPNSEIISIDYVTEGAACTALIAKNRINNNDPLIISDCDHFFRNSKYANLVVNSNSDFKGVIPVFGADGDKWSFTKIDSNWKAVQVAEKVRISPYANIGAYYFSKGCDFVWAAEKMIKDNKRVKNEFYICPVYQELIERGDTILAAPCEEVWGLGTPEDVAHFEKNFNKKDNKA